MRGEKEKKGEREDKTERVRNWEKINDNEYQVSPNPHPFPPNMGIEHKKGKDTICTLRKSTKH